MTTPYGEVTDEMVEAAVQAWANADPEGTVYAAALAALTAALTVRGIQDEPAAKAALKGE